MKLQVYLAYLLIRKLSNSLVLELNIDKQWTVAIDEKQSKSNSMVIITFLEYTMQLTSDTMTADSLISYSRGIGGLWKCNYT